MKKSILVLSIVFLANLLHSMGGIWLLEVEYEEHNVQQHGYVFGDYWANDYQKYIGEDSLFNIEFFEKYTDFGTMKFYREIIDNSAITKKVKFPMHPFSVVEDSSFSIEIKNISHISLKKLWVKDDYMINVLTNVIESDTSWIGGVHTVEYPIGNDVGCRLEVYNFSNQKTDEILLQRMLENYNESHNDYLIMGKSQQYLQVLSALKAKKIVVVELCGC